MEERKNHSVEAPAVVLTEARQEQIAQEVLEAIYGGDLQMAVLGGSSTVLLSREHPPTHLYVGVRLQEGVALFFYAMPDAPASAHEYLTIVTARRVIEMVSACTQGLPQPAEPLPVWAVIAVLNQEEDSIYCLCHEGSTVAAMHLLAEAAKSTQALYRNASTVRLQRVG